MLSLKGTTIKIHDYKVEATKDGITRRLYASNGTKDEVVGEYERLGYEVRVEKLDVSSELFLDGASCPDIQTAHEWLALGYIPKSKEEILQETVDMLVISLLEV